MLRMTVKARTSFDGSLVMGPARRAIRSVLGRFGAYVRREARKSIKPASRKGQVSLPGSPPLEHTGLLRAFTLFSFDQRRQSVVIGPAFLNRPSTALDALEYGGKARITVIVGSRYKKPRVTRTYIANYEPRPWMGPAFRKIIDAGTLDKLWANSIRK